MSLLRVQDLQIAFGGQAVVQGIGFAIAPGEKLAIMGESGSGKTVTALSLLDLAEGATVTGQAWWQTEHGAVDLLQLPERELRAIRGQDVAMVFQEPMTALNPLHTIGHQVAEPMRLHQGLSAAAARKEAIALLGRVGLPDAAAGGVAAPRRGSEPPPRPGPMSGPVSGIFRASSAVIPEGRYASPPAW